LQTGKTNTFFELFASVAIKMLRAVSLAAPSPPSNGKRGSTTLIPCVTFQKHIQVLTNRNVIKVVRVSLRLVEAVEQESVQSRDVDNEYQ
jgi:hypothetical protein